MGMLILIIHTISIPGQEIDIRIMRISHDMDMPPIIGLYHIVNHEVRIMDIIVIVIMGAIMVGDILVTEVMAGMAVVFLIHHTVGIIGIDYFSF